MSTPYLNSPMLSVGKHYVPVWQSIEVTMATVTDGLFVHLCFAENEHGFVSCFYEWISTLIV